MAKCGIRATKAFFLHPDKIGMHPDLFDSTYLDGKIDQCPRNANVHYTLYWTAMAGLSIGFDMIYLHT